jgi:peptidoglycan/xylan/chitin deacetylase (PgdA/CDA1 family)
MRLVSPLLKHVVYPGLAMTGYFRRGAGDGPAIVTYHGVLPAGYSAIDPDLDGSLVTARSLRLQLRLLQDRYHVISPEQFLLWRRSERELPARSVLLTCDDGLRNTLTDMLPILQEYGVSCLFFVTGASLSDTPSMLWYEELWLMFLAGPEEFALGEIGLDIPVTGREEKRSLWWNAVKKLSPYGSDDRRVLLDQVRVRLGLGHDWNAKYLTDPVLNRRFFTLTAAELQKLGQAGMSIGAHTLSHPMLSEMSTEAVWSEISESRHGLQQALGQPVWALAYPFGGFTSVTRRELEMAERAGFQCAFLNVGGGFGAATPYFALPRVHVAADMNLAQFEAHVSGFYRAARRRLLSEADIDILGVGA